MGTLAGVGRYLVEVNNRPRPLLSQKREAKVAALGGMMQQGLLLSGYLHFPLTLSSQIEGVWRSIPGLVDSMRMR